MNVLVTGACGFVGWRTASLLIEEGWSVTGIDNMNDYYDPRLKEYRLRDLKGAGGDFRFLKADIEDFDALSDVFKTDRFQAIINLAARAGVRASIEDPFVYLRTNAGGTLNLLELARGHGINKFVLASTSSLYAGQPMPFKETLPVNEPISPYAATKKSAEALSYTYHYLYGMDVCVLRYFTVYGPAGRPDMSYFRFMKWIDEGHPIEVFGDGSQKRDFTHVDDIAKGTVLALQKTTGYEIVNLGNNKPFELNYMIGLIEENLGKKSVRKESAFHKADMKATWADIGKAKRLLGWSPSITLEEGMKRVAEWYLENRGWLRDIRL